MPSRRLLRMLVVEDDARVRSVITDALRDAADALEAADVSEALAVLTRLPKRHFDLVLVDCILPGSPSGSRLGGVDLVRTIALTWPWIPVIAITGAAEGEIIIQAFRSGARDFLKKPLDLPSLEAAIARVTRRRADPGRERRRAADVAIREAIAFLGEHYTEPVSLERLACMCAMSRSHFSRMFTLGAGVPLRDYIRNLRLERARELLRDSSLSLTEIAVEVGFYDLPHLDKAFRRRFGISPTEFQRRTGAAEDKATSPPASDAADTT